MGNGHRMDQKSKSSLNSGKKPTKPKNLYSIHPDLDMALDKATLKNGEIWRMDFWDYTYPDNDYNIDLDREKLKGLAEFILKYLGNN
jgi:hypothetical protein